MTMSFISDKQTLDDLNLLGRFRKDSVINIFDRTRTRQGRMILEDMFRNPLTDVDSIRARSNEFRYFSGKGIVLPFDEEKAETVEFYLEAHSSHNPVVSAVRLTTLKVRQMFALGRDWEKLQAGMALLAGLVVDTHGLWVRLAAKDSPVCREAEELAAAFDGKVLGYLEKCREGAETLDGEKRRTLALYVLRRFYELPFHADSEEEFYAEFAQRLKESEEKLGV